MQYPLRICGQVLLGDIGSKGLDLGPLVGELSILFSNKAIIGFRV